MNLLPSLPLFILFSSERQLHNALKDKRISPRLTNDSLYLPIHNLISYEYIKTISLGSYTTKQLLMYFLSNEYAFFIIVYIITKRFTQ
ncbi:protein of unknown function [Candidatus Nitrosocaldus cavascurensis]|uniref:Uncharacterized protein n=1 Tax=Candidatus Nitrosocaldus cavascurensis TaxID=2058097 RepID=A0A2K5AQ98_9ARCH|nr:protein of unknown function [Candidatus Nitrosocaldus cavascurensis]